MHNFAVKECDYRFEGGELKGVHDTDTYTQRLNRIASHRWPVLAILRSFHQSNNRNSMQQRK